MKNIKKRLEYLRAQIRAENISYSELAELQSLASYVDTGDVELLEWAGVPEVHTEFNEGIKLSDIKLVGEK